MRVLVSTLMILASCTGGPPSIEIYPGVALVNAAPGVVESVTNIGLRARLELENGGGRQIVCTRRVDGEPVGYLTFEREGLRRAYGVHVLAGQKNGIPVPPPFHGEPIHWPDRNARQGLTYLLEKSGVEPAAAARFVSDAEQILLDEGLRVLFVIAPPWGAVDPDRALPLVLVVELDPG